LGNLVDRITAGQVLDFITTPLRPGVFNIADVMIYTGVFVSLAGAILQRDGDAVVAQATDGEEQVAP
jgi:lipoprotein signal peptidase